MSPDERFLDVVLQALEHVRLEAIIVGATAAIMQDAPVLTRDIDLLIRDTELNRKKLLALSERLGGAPPAPISELTSTLRILGTEIPIDIVLDRIAGGLTFESLKSRAERIEIGGHTALVATLEDVIRSKEAAARPKDVAMLPILRDTLRVKKALEEEPSGP
jgi:predicted nucleotidyltransferase